MNAKQLLKECITFREATELCGRSRQNLKYHAREQHIQARQSGTTWLTTRSEIAKLPKKT